jgi:hypothetical protein
MDGGFFLGLSGFGDITMVTMAAAEWLCMAATSSNFEMEPLLSASSGKSMVDGLTDDPIK